MGLLLAAGVLPGCADQVPTATSEDLVHVDARTVEVLLPFDEVADGLRVLGGYGLPADLRYGLVARSHRDTLDARTLVRFRSFPISVEVEDTTGATRVDSTLTFVGGRVVAHIDTTDVAQIRASSDPPLFRAGATTEAWHPRSATWDLAVDTVGNRVPWTEPGGGPVAMVDTATWDYQGSDSVVFHVDSATVASWADSTNAARGLRLELETSGVRVRVQNVSLTVDARPSVNPDTTVEAAVTGRLMTFVYSPFPEPPPDGLRFGGAPAWRTVFSMSLPESLAGPPELCTALGCPVELTPGAVSSATLVLRTRRSPSAFQPEDTLAMDVRSVLRPDLLPKSPLGETLGRSESRALAPELFGSEAGEVVELPVTTFVRNLIRGETENGDEVYPTVALLSSVEPGTIAFAEFDGPGSDSPPVLRIILTQDDGVTLP